jgi:hypothetical protein
MEKPIDIKVFRSFVDTRCKRFRDRDYINWAQLSCLLPEDRDRIQLRNAFLMKTR